MISPIAAIIKMKLRVDGTFVLTLCGHCMEPLLFEGDRVFVGLSNNLRMGDLVLLLLDSGLLAVYRIVAFDGPYYVAKGDYSGRMEKVAPSCILGVAKKFSFEGGPWVADARGDDEIDRIVTLSFAIRRENNTVDINAARKLIWDLNTSARAAMLKKANDVAIGLPMSSQAN